MKKLLSKFWQNEFYKGGVYLTAATFLINALNYVFTLLAGRILGPAGYSEITTLFSYIVIFSVPVSIISTLVIQKIGSKDEKGQAFAKELEEWMIRNLRKWWFLLILPIIIIPFLSRITNLSPLTTYFLLPMVALTFASMYYYSSLQGLKLFFVVAMIGVVTVIIKLFGPILGLFLPNDLVVVLIFLLFSNIFNFVASLKIFKSSVANIKSSHKKIEKRVIETILTVPFFITTFSILAVTLLNNLDIIFVKKFFSPHDAGIYGAWSLMAKIILYLTGPLLSICLVYFSSRKNPASQNKVFFMTILIFAVFGSVSFLGYAIFAPLLIRLFFGAKFAAVGPYLFQASIFGTLYTTIAFINNYFLAKQSKFSLILPAAIIVYGFLLYNVDKQLSAIINLNVFFATSLVIIYLIAASWNLLYNKDE